MFFLVLCAHAVAGLGLFACSTDEEPADLDDADGGGVSPGQAASSGQTNASSGQSSGGPAVEDCRTAAVRCAAGASCAAGDECDSTQCRSGRCTAPSHDDGLQNADESDVDCGGVRTGAPRCAATQRCRSHADCASSACTPDGVCRSAKSCRQLVGGASCGAGELGDPSAAHEDCCLALPIGELPVALDKYLITAGRLRAFVDDVKQAYGGVPNVRRWAREHRALLGEDWQAAWDVSLPSSEQELVELVGRGRDPGAGWVTQADGAALCTVKDGGTPTYWHPASALIAVGDRARVLSRDELDGRALTCTPIALLDAFCRWDGGRLPTHAEWLAAVRGDRTGNLTFPWGASSASTVAEVHAELQQHASYNKNYLWPAIDNDAAAQVPPPGRFPSGAGPYGHADLLGLVDTVVSPSAERRHGMVRQYSFNEARYGEQSYGSLPFARTFWHSHGALGARCARPL